MLLGTTAGLLISTITLRFKTNICQWRRDILRLTMANYAMVVVCDHEIYSWFCLCWWIMVFACDDKTTKELTLPSIPNAATVIRRIPSTWLLSVQLISFHLMRFDQFCLSVFGGFITRNSTWGIHQGMFSCKKVTIYAIYSYGFGWKCTSPQLMWYMAMTSQKT